MLLIAYSYSLHFLWALRVSLICMLHILIVALSEYLFLNCSLWLIIVAYLFINVVCVSRGFNT